MDNVTIIKELLAEVDGLQRQLEVMGQKIAGMKQRLALAEVSMQADAAALKASQLRVKQLEIIVASQKLQVEELPNRGADESLTCETDESPNRLNDSIKNSVAELVEAPECDSTKKSVAELVEAPESDLPIHRFTDSSTKDSDYSHSFINSSPISRFTDSSAKTTDSSTPSRDARIITDLKKAIGLNDRFRFKHDLFDNNDALLWETIDALNALDSMNEARSYIQARFSWSDDNATAVYFYEILERKFVRS